MNPKTWNQDYRRVVWTVSLTDSTLYCIYVHGTLVHENVSLNDFYALWQNAVNSVA